MGIYLDVLKNWSFDGRAGRKEYWVFQLINTIIVSIFITIFLSTAISSMGYDIEPNRVSIFTLIVMCIYAIAVFIPSLAVTVRRLHDVGLSGWFYLVSFIPGAGGIILLILTCLESKPFDTDYGPYKR